ncbi:hypothetical protein D3C80_1523290 [compost metagenome]
MGVGIDELRRIIAPVLYHRHGQHQRFAAQVCAKLGVWRVGIGRRIGLVVRRVNARRVMQGIPRRFELWMLPVLEIGVLDAVVIHQRKPIGIGLLGDAARLARRQGLGDGQLRMTEQRQGSQHDEAFYCNCVHRVLLVRVQRGAGSAIGCHSLARRAASPSG